MRHKSILDAIGKTPLIKIRLANKGGATVLAKAEFLNPGSIKDRMALYMVKMAEKRGILKPGMMIIEATSGNTGISFAMISAVKGYKMIAIMPEDMSKERQQIIKAFGAKVILTPAKKGPRGAIEKRDKGAKKFSNAWIPNQFENYDNVLAHQKTTGKEIIEQTKGKIDAFVSGVGTGGTLMGVAKALKKVNPRVKIIAVEPAESAVLSGKKPGFHGIQGIGEGFIPRLVDMKIIDEVIAVGTKEAREMTRKLARKEGLLVGISSGANIVAALKVAKKLGKGKVVITVLPDRGERYLSLGLFR